MKAVLHNPGILIDIEKGTKAMLTVNDRLKTLVAAHRPVLPFFLNSKENRETENIILRESLFP